MNYICNNSQNNQNYFDLKFFENDEEFEIKGTPKDNIFGKITQRQRMLSLFSMELIFFTIEQLLHPPKGDNGTTNKLKAKMSTTIDINRLGHDLILKK